MFIYATGVAAPGPAPMAVAAEVRPMLPLAMGLRDVLFASWPVDPDAVAQTLPYGLEVDTFDGRAWLTAVPLVSVAVRPLGLPEALGLRLPEVNLRTYVTHPDGDRGVYFYTLDVDGVAAVLGGRLLHRLPYRLADATAEREGDRVRFRSRRTHPGAAPATFEVTYGPDGDPFRASAGTLEHFLVERYRSYAAGRRGLRYTDVAHTAWALRPASAEVGRNDLFRAAGFDEPEGPPESLLYSVGVDARAARSRKLR